MMENRSFDHLLGWLGTDAAYLDAGRQPVRRATSRIDGKPDADVHRPARASEVATHRLACAPRRARTRSGAAATRSPGTAGTRAGRRRDDGFLAQGQRQRRVRARLLRRRRHALHRAARAALHRLSTAGSRRCSVRRSRTASTCTRRSRRGQQAGSRSARRRHVPRRRRSGTGSSRAKVPARVLLHRPADPAAVGTAPLRPHHALDRPVLRRRRQREARRTS